MVLGAAGCDGVKCRQARVGVSLSPTRQISPAGLVELARLADALEYDSLWVPETWGHDAVSLLALLARETERIRIAAGVFNVFSRSPALIAQTASSLQSMSGGRFILGLGSSGPIVIERWHGVPYRHPVERTRFYVKVIRRALSGDRLDIAWQDMRLKGFRLLDPPAQEVPIYIAALGPRNVRMTGEIADGWLPIFAVRGGMQALMTRLDAGAAAANRSGHVDVGAYIPALLGPRAHTLLAQQLAHYVGGMGTFYHEFIRRQGFEREAQEIRQAWELGDRRRAVRAASPRLLASCTISGSPEEARAALDQYRSEGVALPILTPPHGSSFQEVASMLRSLAP